MPTTAPHTPIARARSRGSVNTLVMIDIATGLSIEPPIPCSARAAISQPSVGARLHSSEPADEQQQPELEDAPAPEPVGGRAGQQQQARDHEHIRVDRPLQPRQRRVQVAADRRQRDVHDRVVHRHDQQAHAADREDRQAPAVAELRVPSLARVYRSRLIVLALRATITRDRGVRERPWIARERRGTCRHRRSMS